MFIENVLIQYYVVTVSYAASKILLNLILLKQSLNKRNEFCRHGTRDKSFWVLISMYANEIFDNIYVLLHIYI